MRPSQSGQQLRTPQLINKTRQIDTYLKTLSTGQLASAMHLSPELAKTTRAKIAAWTDDPAVQTQAIDCFIGDIYSGLRANKMSESDRDYADKTLRILSGLYGILRPYDGVYPYRLEMGYKFPDPRFASLYQFWGDAVAKCLPATGTIVNTSSEEFMGVIKPFVDASRIITPVFLTIDPSTHLPAFRTVHAKIARGAFARWLIVSQVTDPAQFAHFADLGYHFSHELSTPNRPTFVCETFDGKGLSMKTGPKKA